MDHHPTTQETTEMNASMTVSSAQETYDAIVAAYAATPGHSLVRPEKWLMERIEALRAAGYTWGRIVVKLSPGR
jgi:hypothetical protein